MGRGRCQRRRRRHILTTRDNLIIPFFEPPECLETAVYAGSDLVEGIRCQPNPKTKDIGGGFDHGF